MSDSLKEKMKKQSQLVDFCKGKLDADGVYLVACHKEDSGEGFCFYGEYDVTPYIAIHLIKYLEEQIIEIKKDLKKYGINLWLHR